MQREKLNLRRQQCGCLLSFFCFPCCILSRFIFPSNFLFPVSAANYGISKDSSACLAMGKIQMLSLSELVLSDPANGIDSASLLPPHWNFGSNSKVQFCSMLAETKGSGPRRWVRSGSTDRMVRTASNSIPNHCQQTTQDPPVHKYAYFYVPSSRTAWANTSLLCSSNGPSNRSRTMRPRRVSLSQCHFTFAASLLFCPDPTPPALRWPSNSSQHLTCQAPLHLPPAAWRLRLILENVLRPMFERNQEGFVVLTRLEHWLIRLIYVMQPRWSCSAGLRPLGKISVMRLGPPPPVFW